MPAGSVVFLRDPKVKRYARAEEPNTTVLAIGGKPGSHEISAWEYFFTAYGVVDEDPDRAIAEIQAGLAEKPDHAGAVLPSGVHQLSRRPARRGRHRTRSGSRTRSEASEVGGRGRGPRAVTRRPADVVRRLAPGAREPDPPPGGRRRARRRSPRPASAPTSRSSPSASANALCAFSPPNGTSSSGVAAPRRTSPCVTAPIETSVTSGLPSELGIAIASGLVPASGSPPSGWESRAGDVAVRAATRPPSASRRTYQPSAPVGKQFEATTTRRAPAAPRVARRRRLSASGSRARRRRPSARSPARRAARTGRASGFRSGSVSSQSIRASPCPSLPRDSASRKCAARIAVSASENPRAAIRSSGSTPAGHPDRRAGAEHERDAEQRGPKPRHGRIGELVELEHRPAAVFRDPPQLPVGIDDDGIPDRFEKRQIGVAVGVRGRRFEVEAFLRCELADARPPSRRRARRGASGRCRRRPRSRRSTRARRRSRAPRDLLDDLLQRRRDDVDAARRARDGVRRG